MHTFPRSILGAAIAAILAAPTVTVAQSADATLRGSAPANADVTARNVATGTTRRTKANADGNYTLTGLPPGTYRVDAGEGTEQVVTLTVASTAFLDLAAGTAEVPEAGMEEVTVTGRRLVEVKTSEVGRTISQQQIESVPQMTRNFLEFADTVPGIVFQVNDKGATSINAGAQGANNVNVYIDGVGQKGYVRAGVSGQNDGTQGNPFPQLAIGEYKVITSNYKAEYDQISSAAITAQTRSGTNEFEGQAFGTYSADNLRARTPAERDSGTKTPSESKEYGIAFGGPIIQDRMHFFGTYEAKRYNTPVTVIQANANATPAHIAQLPADVQALFGPASIEFEEDLFFAKVDWEPNDTDRFEFSAKLRKETLFGSGIGAGTAPSAAVDTDNDDDRFLLQWKHSGENWFNEVELTYEDAFFVPHVRNADQNGIRYTFEEAPNNDQPIITLNGADPRAGQNKGQKGWSIGNTITFTDLGWGGGDHTIKAGIKYKDVELTAADAVQNNPVFSYHVTPTSLGDTPWKAEFSLPVAGFSGIVTSDDKQLGIFLQDDWEVNDKLTLNLGARYDIEWNPSYLDFETPAFLITALNTLVDTDDADTIPDTPYRDTLNASSDPNVAIDIDDYISTGNNRDAYKGAFAPRLGFSYDFGGDQRHILFGGAGRAYDRTLYDYLQLEQNKFALATTTVEFDLGAADPAHDCDQVANSNCIPWNPAYLTDPSLLLAQFAGTIGETNIMNNDLKVPYSDQYSIGMRNRVGDWNTSASVSRINAKDGFVFSMANRWPNGDYWRNGGQPWDHRPPGLAGVLLIGYNGLETESTQIALSAEKPFTEESRWGATLAYTYTDAEMNNNDRYSFSESLIGAYSRVQSNIVARHRFVATGSYALPWGMQLAGKFTWSTPIPSWFESCYTGGSGVFYPDGALCTPFVDDPGGTGYQALDLQFTKNFALGDLGSMYLRVDVLNVTNEDNLVDYLAEPNLPDGRRTGSRYNPVGNITGFPRTLRASFGVKF
jgi:outer membrane receptor protein involved in Fe transport